MSEQIAVRPRRRAKARGPSTPDAVEIAMEAEAGDGSPDSPAQQVLRRQAQLLEAQLRLVGLDTWERRLSVLLRVLLGLAGLAILALAVMAVIGASRSKAVVVEAFDTPPALAERGLSAHVVAGYVQDALAGIQAENIVAATRANISNAWTDDIAVEVPQTGVSIGEIERLLRKMLGHDTHVSGALVRNVDGSLSLTIRATGVAPQTFTGSENELPALATQAAEHVYGLFEPRLFASYLTRKKRVDEGLAFVEAAYARGPDSVRSELARTWANLLRAHGADTPEIVAKERLAVELDPYNWNAWSNLTGDLYDTEGEEGAARAGRRVQALIEHAPRARRPNADQDAMTNYRPLVQDWTGQLVALDRRLSESGGRAVFASGDNALTLADTHLRRHDWASAERALAAGDKTSPSVQAMRLWLDGARRLEAGDVPGAAGALQGFYALWRTDENTHYIFPSEPCLAGLALGLEGRRAEAEAVFQQIGHWVLCDAARGDMLEAAGDRRAADAQYARAVATAPSLPYAYQHLGVALLGRRDLAGAAQAFRRAQANGPNWADPIKGEGDVLAAEGRWREAAKAYRRAEPFAPNWAALHLAWAEALMAAGKRDEARRQLDAVEHMAPSAGELARIAALRARSPT